MPRRTYYNYSNLYHATFLCYKDSIMKNGLIPSPQNSEWFSKDYRKIFDVYPIFLSNDPDMAISFVESCDEASEEKYKSGVVCFQVMNINEELLRVDPFYHTSFEDLEIEDMFDIENINVCSFAYLDNISAKDINVVAEFELL